MPKHFATLDGLKRAATKLKRRSDISHNAALEQIAREAGFPHYHAASVKFAAGDPADRPRRPQYPVTLFEAWRDREGGMRGTESRTFLLDKPLGGLVKPHQLTGYLSGCRIGAGATIIGYGDSRTETEARFEICRVARALQFMAATGLRPSDGRRCYPKGRWDNRPPGSDHDQCWYHPRTRSYVLSEEPYAGHFISFAGERTAWAKAHGWRSVRARWGSIYGRHTELHLTGKAKGGVNLASLVRRLAKLPPAFDEADWPGEVTIVIPPQPSSAPVAERKQDAASQVVETIELSPELSAALLRLRDIEIAEAGPQAPEPTVEHLGVTITSRWGIAHELERMRLIVDAMPDGVSERIDSMWCDSNAQACYTVTIGAGRWVEGIEHAVREAVLDAAEGFNGLVVEGDGRDVSFDPEWGDDDGVDFAGEPFL